MFRCSNASFYDGYLKLLMFGFSALGAEDDANSNISNFNHFYSHRNVAVRKTTAQFLSVLAERMGPNRLLSGTKDVTERILPCLAKLAVDGGLETRYCH
mgnify:CR=1 FL=1